MNETLWNGINFLQSLLFKKSILKEEKVAGTNCRRSRKIFFATFYKNLRDLNGTKIPKPKCRGNLKLQTAGRKGKSV